MLTVYAQTTFTDNGTIKASLCRWYPYTQLSAGSHINISGPCEFSKIVNAVNNGRIIQKSVNLHGCTNNLYREWVQDNHILQINIHQFWSSLQFKERWSCNVHKTIPKLMGGNSSIYQKEIISIKNTLPNNNYPAKHKTKTEGYKFNLIKF